jgi:hypothetical protein
LRSSRTPPLIAITLAFAAATSAIACLDAVAPTPTSTSVTITPVNRSTRGSESGAASKFQMDFRVRNTGSRTIFLDRIYTRTEKLVDQEWELATETTGAPFASVRTLLPNQSTTFSYGVNYVRDTSPFAMHLEHIRGLYRVRLRFSFASAGIDPLPPEESYSQPFAVE